MQQNSANNALNVGIATFHLGQTAKHGQGAKKLGQAWPLFSPRSMPNLSQADVSGNGGYSQLWQMGKRLMNHQVWGHPIFKQTHRIELGLQLENHLGVLYTSGLVKIAPRKKSVLSHRGWRWRNHVSTIPTGQILFLLKEGGKTNIANSLNHPLFSYSFVASGHRCIFHVQCCRLFLSQRTGTIIWYYGKTLWFARKIRTVFKHYPSTCSICVGPVFWDFPNDELYINPKF